MKTQVKNKNKNGKKIYHVNTNQKKAKVAILIAAENRVLPRTKRYIT